MSADVLAIRRVVVSTGAPTTTGALAALLPPARERVQKAVDRLAPGDRCGW